MYAIRVLLHCMPLGELLSQHGQLAFSPGDGLFVVFNASPGQ